MKDFGYDVKKGIQPVWQEEIATMHYNHYLSLVDKLNNAIMNTEDEDLSAQKILLKYPEHKPLYDLAAEVVNHEVMWFALKPGGVAPSEKMLMMLNIQFGGIERFESLWKSVSVSVLHNLFYRKLLLFMEADGCGSFLTTPNWRFLWASMLVSVLF